LVVEVLSGKTILVVEALSGKTAQIDTSTRWQRSTKGLADPSPSGSVVFTSVLAIQDSSTA
jgi:hypothetical protein